MELCQEEELVWHHAIRVCDRNGLGTPPHRHTSVFVNWARTQVTARVLQIVVRQERKQAVGIFIAVFKLDRMTVGSKALEIVISCG